jgi:hypothetical protein
MRTSSVFSVSSFETAETVLTKTTAASVDRARIEKTFTGDIVGMSEADFLGGQSTVSDGSAAYVAFENFEGSVGGRAGSFSFVHVGVMYGGNYDPAPVTIVPGSGTGALTGITGTGFIRIDADGTHRLELEYDVSD